jgi:hypothetical protein
VFYAAPACDAQADVAIDATAVAAISSDGGLPYTIPFVLGGAVSIVAYSNAPAEVTVNATAVVEVAADAHADFTILATAAAHQDVSGGLPYLLPFVLGGSVGTSTLPVDIPFVLA